MKRILYYINIITLLLALSTCRPQPDDNDSDLPEGYTRITFKAAVVEPQQVNVRAVDPDGLGVNNMTLFCFNEFGLYISKSTATLKKQDHETGTYEAVISSDTEIIHFLGNHSEGLYDDSNFPGQTESMVIANMEGGSGMLVYWSRFQIDRNSDKDILQQLADLSYTINDTTYNGIKLIRNQAKVSINDWDTDYMKISGFRTVNIHAFGTVAPHHPEHHFEIVENWEQQEDFVTLPNNKAKMSDIVDINTKQEDYVFESENEGDNLVSVIIKGRPKHNYTGNDLYYRVVMQNNDGSSFMIRRNHHYKINIIGELSYGMNTFEEALVAPATNNAWISIDSWVNEISNGNETLWVEKTSYVLSSEEYAGKNWTIPYKYTNRSGNTEPTITWIENNVAYNNIGNNYNASNGEGTITLNLHPMYEGNEQQSGKLLIKHGKLQREVEIILIKKQLFTPAWVSAQVYSGSANENVTIMFTIPDNCPESLFPFPVLVSVNHLDVRTESGDQLPVLIKGEEGYFGQEWEGINYKYVYTVTAPGKHRLFFHTILEHKDGDIEDVHLEAQFFETITKNVVFAGHESHKAIFVEGLHDYGNHFAEDEKVYYMLVPAKKASPQMFTISLKERQNNGTYTNINHADKSNTNQWHKNGHDEFLFYTKYLTFYDELFDEGHEGFDEIKDQEWECEVKIINESQWSTNGRVLGLRTYGYKETDSYKYGLQADGTYNVYMLTNDPRNTDVVRIASNNVLSKYVFENDRTGTPYGDAMYDGNEYRSVIFDVGRYRPFRFAPQIKVSDKNGANDTIYGTVLSNEIHAETEELTEEIVFSYEPGQKIDIMLDVTSFKGSDGRSVHPFGELYGESFEIYIDAPMLRIDTERIPNSWLASKNPDIKVDKLRRHPTIEGRFIYTVDQFRDRERNFGFAEALNKDVAKSEYDKFGKVVDVADFVDQSGERKLLPFVKSTITTKYNISISSEKEKVIFWDKTFKVKTQHIEGNIKYKTSNGDLLNVPKDAFVAFVRHYTGARIGVMTIHDNGRYELNLRHEYKFDWEGDPIELFYTVGNVTYSTQIEDIATLFQMSKDNETIILNFER